MINSMYFFSLIQIVVQDQESRLVKESSFWSKKVVYP